MRRSTGVGLGLALVLGNTVLQAAPVAVDLTGHDPKSGVTVRAEDERLFVGWPIDEDETGRLVIDLRPGKPLIDSLGVTEKHILDAVDPVTFVTVGTRVGGGGRPPGMSPFNEFFDSPAQRPHQTYRSTLDLKSAKVVSQGRRATVTLGDLTIGPFHGALELTVFNACRLVQIEAVVSTRAPDCAFFYDAGVVTTRPSWQRLAWTDTDGVFNLRDFEPDDPDRALAVRNRAITAETENGSASCFPPPHQYFFPRDFSTNLGHVWTGRNHRGLEARTGFGIRQAESGGGNFSPWCNAPPGTEQRLGVFYLLSRGPALEALSETLRFTHDDRFPPLAGHQVLTSHWHLAVTMAALHAQSEKQAPTTPDFVRMFKEMGVNVVHLAEFHGDGHPGDPGPLRLPELDALFAECRRLSDDSLLFLPGEEANVHFGGHWLYLFPQPVSWTMQRPPGTPFLEKQEGRGNVYHVGNRDDMLKLLEIEHGLAWTAHPRIKSSSHTPDQYMDADFFRSPVWLGAAWKAMPADLSLPRLGTRVLDLGDDMNNRGAHKQVLGEVDVFKIDHTHELYGHMNVNYVQLDKLPTFGESWQPVLDALRGGRFFVTTGEVRLPEFRIGGKTSGETLVLPENGRPELTLSLEWTFPLRFVEVISGDGAQVYRERVDLSDTGPFGRRTLTLTPALKGRKWARAEAWDVACNGAFTQPVWLSDK